LLVLGTACGDPPAAGTAVPGCGTDGRFEARLYGSLDTELDWGPGKLECQGMPRPKSAGARLRFAGQAGADKESVAIAFIFGIPGLERGQAAKELPTNVTVIDETDGRFFATQDIDSCWSDIDDQVKLNDSDSFVVRGILYCLSPIAELHGSGNVLLSDVHFVGVVDWKKPE